jgi:hypothetical protein
VVNHGAVPGRARRNDGDQHPAGHQQGPGVCQYAVLGALTILEEVGWVGQHQAHAAFGNADPFEGAGNKFGLGEALAGNGGAFGADLDPVQPRVGDLLTGQKQIALTCRWIEDSGSFALRKRQQTTHNPFSEQRRRAHKGRIG